MWEEELRVPVGVGGARLRGLGLGAALRGSLVRVGVGVRGGVGQGGGVERQQVAERAETVDLGAGL